MKHTTPHTSPSIVLAAFIFDLLLYASIYWTLFVAAY